MLLDHVLPINSYILHLLDTLASELTNAEKFLTVSVVALSYPLPALTILTVITCPNSLRVHSTSAPVPIPVIVIFGPFLIPLV